MGVATILAQRLVGLAILAGLLGALGGGAAGLLAVGWRNRRRRRQMEAVAAALSLKFMPTEPFDLTNRYHELVLASAGHSARAENVIYGTRGGWTIRMFDYIFEAGHGPGRLTRRYHVMLLEGAQPWTPALLWHEDDAEAAPLAARRPVGRQGPFLVVEGGAFAAALGEAFTPLAQEPASVQAAGRWVARMTGQALPAARVGPRLSAMIDAVARLAPGRAC